jgi:hypothetical protein
MASEDPTHGLSVPEEDGTVSQDHAAPLVLADLMRQLEEGFFTVLTEGVKNEENQTILNERSVGCYEEKNEAAESGVSTVGSDQGFKNEDCKLNEAFTFIDDHTVEQGEDEVSLVENEIQSWRIATEDSVERGTGSAREEEVNFVSENEKEDGDEVQGRILDDLVKQFLCKEEQVCNENEEYDEDSRHREILLSLANWQGCKEKTGDNVVSLAKAERFKKQEVEEIRETQKVDYQKKCRVRMILCTGKFCFLVQIGKAVKRKNLTMRIRKKWREIQIILLRWVLRRRKRRVRFLLRWVLKMEL